MSYVPLGIRTEFSFSESMCRSDELVERARSLELPAVGVADLHATWALPGFTAAARAAGIRPLVAVRLRVDVGAEPPARTPQLTLHAMNAAGFANLVRLVNRALERAADSGTPSSSVTLTELADLHDGVLALDGAEDGPVGQLLVCHRFGDALRAATQLKEVMGSEQLLIEVRRGADPRRILEPETLRVARISNLRVVATTDVRYVEANDARAYGVLQRLPMPGGTRPQRGAAPRGHAHLRSAGEMQRLFADLPEALESTLLVAEKCSLATDALMTPGSEGADPDGWSQAELALRSARAACERFAAPTYQDLPAAVRDRIAEELVAIEEANLASGLLLASDAARHAVRKRIPIGPGPGAAAGSYIAYLLGLSEADPLRSDLHFRAATAVRGTRPEIRLEVGHRGCGELIRAMKSSRRCALAHVATLARLRGGALLRAAADVLGLTAAEIGQAEELLVGHASSAAVLEFASGVSHRHGASERVREVVEVCSRLEGLPYHAFPRAGSLLVLPRVPASSIVLQPAGMNQTMVQLTERDAEALGWLRLELDAVRHLTILSDAANWVSKRTKPVTPETIPLDDEATFRKLAHSDTSCLVHLESPLAQRALSLVRPARLGDLADVLALCAQARAGLDQTQVFAARRGGRATTPVCSQDGVGRAHDVLSSTHGLILYHEQLCELAMRVAGMDASAAQSWVHALSSGDRTHTGRLQRDFIVGALDRGAALAEVEALFAQAVRSQPLASRAHCLSMARAAYRAAYMLVHHRREFMFSVLRNSEGQQQRQGRVHRLLFEESPPSAPRPASRQRRRGERAERGQLQLAFGPGAPRDAAEAAAGQEAPARVRPRVWIAGRIQRRA